MTLGPVRFDNSLATFTNAVNVSGNHTTAASSIALDLVVENSALVENTLTVDLSSYLSEVYIDDKLQLNPSNIVDITTSDASTHQLLAINTSGIVRTFALGEGPGGTLPGMVIPFYGQVTNSGGTIVSPSTVDGSSTYYPYNMDSGAADSSWVVCNGSNGTPDLRCQYIVGAAGTRTITDNSIAFSPQASSTLGQTSHNISIEHLPAHRHRYEYAESDGGEDVGTVGSGEGSKNVRARRWKSRMLYTGRNYDIGYTNFKQGNADYDGIFALDNLGSVANTQTGVLDSNEPTRYSTSQYAGTVALSANPPTTALWYIMKLPA